MVNNFEKSAAIAQTVIETAGIVTNQLKNLPVPKRKRNVFVKSYSRRPMNRNKTASTILQISCTLQMSAFHMAIIQATPIPKYKPGTNV